jgi:hypothetical protein
MNNAPCKLEFFFRKTDHSWLLWKQYTHQFSSEEVKLHIYKQLNDRHLLKKKNVVWIVKYIKPVPLFKTHIV